MFQVGSVDKLKGELREIKFGVLMDRLTTDLHIPSTSWLATGVIDLNTQPFWLLIVSQGITLESHGQKRRRVVVQNFCEPQTERRTKRTTFLPSQKEVFTVPFSLSATSQSSEFVSLQLSTNFLMQERRKVWASVLLVRNENFMISLV
jgi:hypothetical protein